MVFQKSDRRVTNPLVSIVLVTYNSSAFVRETLQSVGNQSYSNVELIISDDGSTDSTIEICENWATENRGRFVSLIIVAAPENTGIPANCNRGIGAASGDWIKLLAGDDLLLPECIKANVQFALQNPAAKVVYSDAKKIDENSRPFSVSMNFYARDNDAWRDYFFRQDSKRQLKLYGRQPLFLVSPTIFFQRQFWENIGGFDEDFTIFEDVAFNIRALNAGTKLLHMPAESVAYRLHSQSISKMDDPTLARKRLRELQLLYHKYRKPILTSWNIFDFLCRLEAWFQFDYVLRFHLKGARFLARLNLYHGYQRLIVRLVQRRSSYGR